MKKSFILLSFSVLVFEATAQDLSSIGKADPLSVNGSISLNQIGYGALGIDSRRDPYSYFASGSLTFNLYGWSVPFTFAYSNQQGSFSQPFNQYSLHPTYKEFTGHLGYTSMTFSSYSLAGHLFLGGGVEGSVGRFSGSAMYGRLLKAVQPDTLNPEKAVYERRGYGTRISYQHEGTNVDFSVFRGKDIFGSVDFSEIDSITVKPEENLVFNVVLTQQFLNRLSVNVDYARSALTRDTRVGSQDLGANKFYGNLGGLFLANSTTAYYDAFKLGSTFTGNGYSIGMGYERVDPGYRSHGAYFFVNDLENITLNASKVLFGGRISISASGGVQRDNLNNEKISSMERFVGSATVGYTPSNKLNLSGSYSNFQTYTNIRSQFVDLNQLTPYDNMDTLNFRQVSESINVTGNYVLQQSESRRQNLVLNLTLQGARDEQGGVEQPGGSTFFLVTSNYSINFVPIKTSLSAAFNYNNNETAGVTSESIGPSLSFSKSLKDNKVNLSSGLSWNQSLVDGASQGSVTSFRFGGRVVLREKHNLNLNVTAVNRNTPPREETAAESFTEFTATLGYSYSFSKSNILSRKK